MPKICVKWGTKKFEVDASTENEPLVLKSQLFELTGVLPERQRVLIKGKQLPDDNWNDITLQDGLTIMLMGSVEVEPPIKSKDNNEDCKQKFDKEKLVVPVGLKNLGNSCYLNACIQSFRVIPELLNALENYTSHENMFLRTFKKLYDEMKELETKNFYNGEQPTKSFIPFYLLTALHSEFTQFSSRDDQGQPQQQDASEVFSESLRFISSKTEITIGGPNQLTGINDEEIVDKSITKVKTSRIFETEFDVELKCLETDEEPVENVQETHLQVSCFVNQDVKYIQSGIKNWLTEEIVKHSKILNRDAKYQKKSLISRLPEYLVVQIVRNFYKKKDKINAKILKDVKFPMNLDVYDLCSPNLQEKLNLMRECYKIYDEKCFKEMRESKLNDNLSKEVINKMNFFYNFTKDTKFFSHSFVSDPGSNNSGFYELKAVITHKGRSSDSGHYVSWIRYGYDRWIMCDDEEVHPITKEDVLKLSGGGDWHCAYVLVYGPRLIPNENLSKQNKNSNNQEVLENVHLSNNEVTKMEVN